MDKSKKSGSGGGSSGSGGSKKHTLPSSSDLIALGTKRPESGGGTQKSTKSYSGPKKDGPPPAKKIRTSPPPKPKTTGGTIVQSTSKVSKIRKDPLDTTASSLGSLSVPINAGDLSGDKFFTILEKASKVPNSELGQNLLVTALKRLKNSGVKDKEQIQICQNLIIAVGSYANFFRTTPVVEALISLVQLKTKDISNIKAKLLSTTSTPPFAIFALNLMFAAYCHQSHWPVQLINLWVEDSAGDRNWVDSSLLKPLIDNLMLSFGTVLPSSSILPPSDGGGTGSGGGSSPNPSDDSSGCGSLSDEIKQMLLENNRDWDERPLRNRYSGLETHIEGIILDYAAEVVHKRSPDIPKNLLRALSATTGLSGVRTWVVSRLEQWLHNGKLGRVAQELLLYLCINATCNTSPDIEVILNISKLRMKTKPLTHFHSIAMREMVRDNQSNMRHVLNLTIYNELTPQRNPNNLPILGAILGGVPESRAMLADIFIDLLQKREDFHPALRLLLREIVRSARFECDLQKFVKGLVQERDINWTGESRERAFLAISDLILLSMFLSVSPQVREASAVAAVRGEPKDISTLQNFRTLVSSMQSDAVTWLFTVAPKMFKPVKSNFLSALSKIFLKEPVNDLATKEGWPPESEKNLFGRLCLEVGFQESSLVFVLMMAVSKDHPVSCNDALDIVEQIVCRAAIHKTGLTLTKIEIIELLFRLSEYRHPDNISLPLGYEPPKMAVSNFYWRVWAILCVITAFNPVTFGQNGWSNYPTLKVFMEMCMTNSFNFPTVSCSETETSEEIIARELQTGGMEREEILEFETHLAAASSKTTITESTSLLLKQLMRLEPFGPPRAPPQWILTQLQAWNEQMSLGHLLCGSRNPDFLLDLIQRNSEPMPWLARLVSEGSLEILPDQCLCEFLMGRTEAMEKAFLTAQNEEFLPDKSPKKGNKAGVIEIGLSKEDAKLLQLLHYLQDKIQSNSDDGEARKVLEYFLKRLSAPKMQQRSQALKALKLLLISKDDTAPRSSTVKSTDTEDWLLDGIPALHIFAELQENVLILIRQALSIENEPTLLCRYLEFLSTWAQVSEDLEGLALDVANLVVERNNLISLMMNKFPTCFLPLFDIFFSFMKKVRGPRKDSYKWSDSQDQVLVTWALERLEGTFNILIIHAIVILISSYSMHEIELNRKNKDLNIRYTELLDIWFPKGKGNSPKGFLLNTMEEAVLFPDWVKLKMVRSNNPRLLDAATQDLEVEQLLLFIQSFGIPVQAMTALLYIMDTMTERDEEKIVQCINAVNVPFVYHLIQAHWKRGVVGGQLFFSVLKARCGLPEPQQCSSAFAESTKLHPVRPILQFDSIVEKAGKHCHAERKQLERVQSVITSTDVAPQFSFSGKRKSIEHLSKELLHLASPPSQRRRLSVPVTKENDLLSLTPRRHSAYIDNDNYSSEDAKTIEKTKSNHLGELVDQISQIEPCIVRNALEFQLPLLFGKNSEGTAGCRSFLMTALAHQAGWETINRCLTLFLKDFDPVFDPSAILDLIQATHTNPKLWQGVDKYSPKHQPDLSVMHFTFNQLAVMADLIVEEISQAEMKNTKFSISNLLGPGPAQSLPATAVQKRSKHGIQARVRLWLQCSQQDKTNVDGVIKNLMNKKWRNPCVKRFIQQVYVEFPEIVLIENWHLKSDDMNMTEDDVSSLLDSISHGLITALANTQNGKDWAKKQAREYEICLRKLASLHPTLLLRQLKLMGSLLEGKVHLDSGAFHQQNHNLPFIVFLALFDLMQPYILKHFKSLKPILVLYFKMFQNYGTTKDYSSSMSRFAILLHNFLSTNAKEVNEFLGQHYSALKELSTFKYYTEVIPLHNLLSCLDPVGSTVASTSSPVSTAPAVNGDYLTPMITALHDRLLNVSSDEEAITVLSELDTLSNRNPTVLDKFCENLTHFLKSESESCRNLAFSLALKHSTYYPSKTTKYLDTILLLLEDDNAHLRDTMIDRIHEFVILAQERGEEILTRMFQLGISSNMNFLTSIQKSLSQLRNYSCIV